MAVQLQSYEKRDIKSWKFKGINNNDVVIKNISINQQKGKKRPRPPQRKNCDSWDFPNHAQGR